MRKLIASIALTAASFGSMHAQPVLNGMIDDFTELTTVITEEFVMPDGVKLQTDIYLPILRDCVLVPVVLDIPIPGVDPITFELELLPRNKQLLLYDSIYRIVDGDTIGEVNPNPYKLPMVLSRTPYNKGPQNAEEGAIIGLLGYAYAKQDMRGRYTSGGVYLPLMSDSWNKNAYHPNYKHVLDVTDFDDARNGNRHEDGYWTIKYVVDSLKRAYDLNGDGINETIDGLTTGRIGMFGASALGYNQYQAAAAHKINVDEPGLKCILPIVAPADFYKSVGFPNGVLRDRLVTGWLAGQIFSGTDDDLIPIDNDIDNNLHSSADYNLPQTIEVNGEIKEYGQNMFAAANLSIDHFLNVRYRDAETNEILSAGYYPNSPGRADMDVSRAMVDENGEAVSKGKRVRNPDGSLSLRVVDTDDSDPDGLIGFGHIPRGNRNKTRWTNMEVPGYHLVGWWDIFIDGQAESWSNMRKYLSPKNRNLQKLVIGPWAHQTMGNRTTGDRTYPENVIDVMGINFDDFDVDNLKIGKALNSELIGWYRYNLNYAHDEYLGEPKFRLPESNTPVQLANLGILGTLNVRIPSEDLIIPFEELIGVLNGSRPISGLRAEVVGVGGLLDGQSFEIDVPEFSVGSLIPGLAPDEITPIPFKNFADPDAIQNVRMYVVGPNDSPVEENQTLGNYWLAADTFPLPEGRDWDAIQRLTYYMHKGGTLDENAPTFDEGFTMFVHDPDDPIRTVGGANMIVRTPDGERDSQGQFNLKDPRYAPYTIDRPGVVGFEMEVQEDSLCIVGFPTVTLFAKSNVGGLSSGPTDTDFHVRIIDVYPDGREYFVQDGCVNARARDYAKMLVEEPWKDSEPPYIGDNIPFTNIEIGEIYEYTFNMLPIAYTFGKGHKVKILVSSSNYNRFQVNPNLPINDGEFFRRKPGDGRGYNFRKADGSMELMMPRVAIQRIAFSPEHPSRITLPVMTKLYTSVEETETIAQTDNGMLVYPNPATDQVTIIVGNNDDQLLRVMDINGRTMFEQGGFADHLVMDVSQLASGIYFVELNNMRTGERSVEKLIRQ
jgi:predicted acyl esterase